MPKFVPRQRKHRVIARQKDDSHVADNGEATTIGANPNALEVLPTTAAERNDRKRQLKEELQASQPKMSGKKRKRLDKYIDTKLRKEDTLALIKRLEAKHKSVDRSLLVSAKKLGRQSETKKEAFVRALLEKEKGVRVKEADEVLFEKPRAAEKKTEEESEMEDENEDDDEEDYSQEDVVRTEALPPIVASAPTEVLSIQTSTAGFGSGLKRPLELDEQGKPIIKTRKRAKTGPVVFDVAQKDNEQLEWSGFSDDEAGVPSGNGVDDDGDEDADMETESLDIESSTGSEVGDESEELSGSDDGTESASSDEEVEEPDEGSDSKGARKARTSAFKAWAEQQRNETIGFAPSTAIGSVEANLPVVSEEVKKSFVPRPIEREQLPEGFIQNSAIAKDRRAYAVAVQRSDEIQTARLALPVLVEEQRVMEAIFNNDVVIVSGATGSGKTTQVPQFLFEYGFGDPNGPTPGMVGVTQPRRVAAVSMAKRVSEELGDAGKRVAHQIRFDSTVGKSTAIKFMTDGVLLREMSEDFSLRKYSAIVIDEAHERTVNTDILISLMSRCVNIRRELAKEQPKSYAPLKLVIMSATLRVEDFRANSRLFSTPPPLIEAEGRQYDVKVHWTKRTSYDYAEEAFTKVSRGHRKLPPGGMLVFLTGQNEIRQLVRRLKDVFQPTDERNAEHPRMRVDAKDMPVEAEDLEDLATHDQVDYIDGNIEGEDEDSTAEEEDPDAEFKIEGEEPASDIPKIHVLPLYSQLPSKEQLKVFEQPPEGSRLIVLATNVAETSLTIPGIRYVFDCGRHKERTWDRAGVQTFRTTWISKASADQRMGRAGRTGPGHCYRLYSSAMYESAMPEFAQPEIFRSPLEGVVLQLKSMNIGRVDNFPFPTPPESGSIVKAERQLKNLGALDSKGRITKLGKELQNYPLSPRFAQMLRLGVTHKCAHEIIAIVAALDVPEIIVPENQLDLRTPSKDQEHIWTAADDMAETAREVKRKEYNSAQAKFSRLDFNRSKITPQADAIKLFAAMLDYSSTDDFEKERFATENFLREKGMREAGQLREQLSAIVRHVNPTALPATYNPKLSKPNEKAIALLKQIVAAGFTDQIAIRADLLPTPPVEERKPKRAIDVKYKALFDTSDSAAAAERQALGESDEDDGFVYIHPSSLLARLPSASTPRYIIYQRLQRSQPSRPGARSRVRMHPLTPVSGEQIASLARGTGLLEVGKPIGKIDVLSTGEKGQERRECDVMLSLIGDSGGVGWPLVRKRVVQRRVPAEGWIVEAWKN